MKWFKRIGIAVIFSPLVLIAGVILFEIVGLCVNHAASYRQTKRLQAELTDRILDIGIVSIQSETGNTSGTGNHVECVSTIVFSTGMDGNELKNILSGCFDLDDGYRFTSGTDDGLYSIQQITSAPFPDNIEGH